MLFRMSYAYDVPRYFDFVVEANSKEEAEKLAEAALSNGAFDDVDAVEPESFDKNDERVFVEAENYSNEDAQCEPRLIGGKIYDFDEIPETDPVDDIEENYWAVDLKEMGGSEREAARFTENDCLDMEKSAWAFYEGLVLEPGQTKSIIEVVDNIEICKDSKAASGDRVNLPN